MELLSKLKTLGYAIAIGGFMFACSQETRNETNADLDETHVDRHDAVVIEDEDYNETSAWVDRNSTRAETASEEEWNAMRAEYRERETKLEAKSSTWDDKTKQEWQKVKDRWNKTEDKVQERLKRTDDVDVDVDVRTERRD